MPAIHNVSVCFFSQLPGSSLITQQVTGFDPFEDISRGDACYTLETSEKICEDLESYIDHPVTLSALSIEQIREINNLIREIRNLPENTYVALEG